MMRTTLLCARLPLAMSSSVSISGLSTSSIAKPLTLRRSTMVIHLSRRAFSSIPDPPTSNHPHTDLPGAQGKILYTETDEAPALATFCLYPILRKVRYGTLCAVIVDAYDIYMYISTTIRYGISVHT